MSCGSFRMRTADASDARKGSLALNVARYEASEATALTLMRRMVTEVRSGGEKETTGRGVKELVMIQRLR